ncbi:DMT family transporter [Halobacillus sp. Marseille-Q1614]|uniref:DMT family transporter n=1 Tax=Halobacillus sp. Marseille-Q1614 TaxID=2709134 RepID=UPI0020C27434|nr:EamA family transporter [Halobacillus sp. Marseille-Q1614]
MQKQVPFFMVLFAAALWGTTGTAQTFLTNSHPISVGAMRLAVGGLFLLIVAIGIKKFSFRRLPRKPLIFAALCMAGYQPFFFSAVNMTGVAIGTVVGIGSAPIMAGLMDWLFLKRKKTARWWLATLLSILGCFVLFLNGEAVVIQPLGILFALAAGLSFAGYTLLSERLIGYESPVSVTAVIFCMSAVILSPFLLIFDISWVLQSNGMLVSLHLGIAATGVAYLLFSKGLVRVPGSTAVTLSIVEPLTAALLGVFIVGESFSFLSWMGMIFIFLGLTILSLPAGVFKNREAKLRNIS